MHGVNHEIELGVILKKGGKNVKVDNLDDWIGAYCLLQDYTNKAELLNALD